VTRRTGKEHGRAFDVGITTGDGSGDVDVFRVPSEVGGLFTRQASHDLTRDRVDHTRDPPNAGHCGARYRSVSRV